MISCHVAQRTQGEKARKEGIACHEEISISMMKKFLRAI